MAKSDKQQRKLAREAVLQALYAKHVSSEEAKKVLHDILKRYEFDKMTKKFVEELFNSTIEFSDDLDKHIESNHPPTYPLTHSPIIRTYHLPQNHIIIHHQQQNNHPRSLQYYHSINYNNNYQEWHREYNM